jgi:cell division protein FtsB
MPSPEQTSVAEADAASLAIRRENKRWLLHLVAFATCAVGLNALIGERGLVERWRLERQAAQVASEVSAIRRENGELRRRIERLTSDPRTIEHIARAQLGLLRRGEMLVLVKRPPTLNLRREPPS